MRFNSTFVSGITANGTYCALNADQSVAFPSATGVLNAPNNQFVSSTFYCSATGTITGGVIVPVMLGPDGNYHPIATSTTLSAAGFVFILNYNGPLDGIAIQVTTPVAGGGSVYLQCSAAQL